MGSAKTGKESVGIELRQFRKISAVVIAQIVLALTSQFASAQNLGPQIVQAEPISDPSIPQSSAPPKVSSRIPAFYQALGVACSACRGTGKVSCAYCGGRDLTQDACDYCHGIDLTTLACQYCQSQDLTKLTCTYCRGSNLTTLRCNYCNRSGASSYGRCAYCRGAGWQPPCVFCRGSGKQSACIFCRGSGRQVSCFFCRGTGKKGPCLFCRGSAALGGSCTTCSGTGTIEQITGLSTAAAAPIAENGSDYGQISDLTGRPRTVFVSGYVRADGTYVQSHYRSPPGQGNSERGPPATLSPPTTANQSPAENGSYSGQLNAYGVPKTVHVNGYFRQNGTYVRGHYRGAPRR